MGTSLWSGAVTAMRTRARSPRPSAGVAGRWRWELAVLLGVLLSGCRNTSPTERAMHACRSAVSQHLVDPATSSFDEIEAERGVSSAWRVTLTVKAKSPDG